MLVSNGFLRARRISRSTELQVTHFHCTETRSSKNMRRNLSRLIAIVLCCSSLLWLQSTTAQQTKSSTTPKPFELTVDSIMRGPRLVGYPPSGVYWSQDSQHVYFRWKQAD